MSAHFQILAAGKLFRQQFAQRAAGHQPGRHLGQRNARRLGNIRNGARGARIHLDDVDVVHPVRIALDGELEIDQADDLQRESELARVGAKTFSVSSRMPTAGSTQDESPE